MIEWVFPAGDPVEQILLASGGTRNGLLALADQVLAAFDTLVEVANGPDEVTVEKLSALRLPANNRQEHRARRSRIAIS
jgi:hypothetical protein